MPDGDRLVVVVPADGTATDEAQGARPQINVVLNWFSELRERVPVN